MLVALTAGQKTGLAVVAAAFVVFALASSFLFPRYSPNFPGRWLKAFVAVSVLFTIGMLAAVLAFGKESEEEKGAHGTEPPPTETAPPATGGTTAPPPPPEQVGDPASGKELFAANGCGGCHVFAPAGSKGAVGPGLDELAASAERAGVELQEFARQSIAEPDAYVSPGYQPNVMPDFGETLSAQQIDDLVAFLTQNA